MSSELGKEWEGMVKEWLEQHNICFDRIHDQMSGLKGSKNVCDFDAYIYPHMYYIECKECAGDRFDMLHNIDENQWIKMLKKDREPGVRAGYVIWMSKTNRAFWVSPLKFDLYYSAGIKSLIIQDLEQIGIEFRLFQKNTKWHLETFLDVVEERLNQASY